MRSLITLTAWAIVGWSTGEAEPHPTVIHHTVYDGYFVSNEFEPNIPASFVVLQDQAAFDRIFGVAAVMFDRSHRLQAKAFRSNMVIAVVHRDRANITYRNVLVTRDGTILRVNYTTKEQRSPLTEYASPLILSVPRDTYSAVSFIENDKTVKSLPLITAN